MRAICSEAYRTTDHIDTLRVSDVRRLLGNEGGGATRSGAADNIAFTDKDMSIISAWSANVSHGRNERCCSHRGHPCDGYLRFIGRMTTVATTTRTPSRSVRSIPSPMRP